MKTLRLILFAAMTILAGSVSAQVQGVNYQLKYDTASCQYDAFIIINSGSADSISQRIQFNSQFSVITPTGTTVTVTESYMPLQNNSGYTGTVPTPWALTTSDINPSALPGYDLHSIIPSLNPTCHYNNLTAGDTVKIFSISTAPIVDCGDEIRMYVNGSDPTSVDLDSNADFSNGFTMGSTAQIYQSNSVEVHPPAPTIVSLSNACGGGIEIDLTATTSVCQGPLTYQWAGPNSYSSTAEDVNIVPALPANNGLYSVTITDAFGCTTVASVTAYSKPDAGPDTTICATDVIVLTGAPTSGTWTKSTGNTNNSQITLSPLTAGSVQVTTAANAMGDYDLVYSVTSDGFTYCRDTMTVTVNRKPQILIAGANNICAFDSVRLVSNIPGGTWSSNAGATATINQTTGWATGLMSGTVTFTYTTTDGCSSVSPVLTINPAPTASIAQDTICVGSTTLVSPQTGGTWATSAGGIATVTNAGVVTGVSPGVAELRFTESSSGCTSDTVFVTVIPVPEVVFIGNDSLCVGGMTSVSPSTGVTWTSSNINVLTINNQGQITGVGVGQATVTVTDLASGCVSDASPTIYVLDAPTVAITGPTNLCIDEFSQATPTTGGTWMSSSMAIATITNAGVITAVGSGPVTFTFTDAATGCTSTTETLIVDAPPSVNVSDAIICIAGTTTLSPNGSLGTWSHLNPTIAFLSGGNTVTGQATGIAGFIFTSFATGCESDTLFVTVEPGTDVSGNDPVSICIGDTTHLQPNTGGVWTSLATNVATVTSNGIVTGVGSGDATFYFTSNATLCQSDPTPPVTVNAAATLAIQDNSLCIGDMTTITSSSFGTWAVTDGTPDVASIDPSTGEVTAIAPGSETFTFTDGFTLCETVSGILVVNQTPEVTLEGPDEICEGTTTNVSPTSGGTWVSSSDAIATVTNGGVVSGISAGTVTLTYTETTTGCASETVEITIIAATPVTDPVDDELCIGETTTVTPTSGGVWMSSATSVATISPSGVITAVSSGSAFFTFTSTTGSAQCASNSTAPVVVNPNPTVTLTANDICVGDTTFATTSTAGTWSSTNTGVATIDAATGMIIGITPGTTTFFFLDATTGCESLETPTFTVGNAPTVTSGAAQICVGETTNVFPSTGGTWTSSDPTIATVTNQGLVTAVSPGNATFTFTENGGCTSAPTGVTEVTPGPDTEIGPDDQLCIGETLQILPASGGTWVSSDDQVATISNTGLITAIGAGIAEFTFTSATTGCSSVPTDPVTVNAPAATVLAGAPVICINGFSQMNPNSGGTWTSSDPSIATITNAGLVTGVTEGCVTFIFTPSDTGCPSAPSDELCVSPSPDAVITGLSEICIGANTTLSPTEGGTWTSSDPGVATVTDNGIVTAHAAGVVTFTFSETATGCNSASATDPVTITNCINPDFNATFVNIPVDGDVNTNDGTPVGTTYGPTPVYTSGPAGAIFTLTVESDGTYTFVTDMIGVYTWDVPVCIPPVIAGCQTAELIITVVDFLNPDLEPIANIDIATTQINESVDIPSLANDKCVVVGGCDLDPSSVTIVSDPANGAVTVDALTGDVTYTPYAGFVGQDTLRYQVCVDGEPTNCAQADQIITIISATAPNTTIAADDFNSGGQDTPITGTVAANDYDPEGDTQTVTAQVTPIAGVGTLTLLADGTYEFVPEETFYGPVDFPYETCDDALPTNACANATLHILVVRDFYLQVRVYLEGAFINNGNAVGSHTRPLMRDNLRVSTFNNTRYIPDSEPYADFKPNGATLPQHWETEGVNSTLNQAFWKYGYDMTGVPTKFQTIPDPATIFATTGENAVVDWVSVELRDKNDNTTIVAQRSGLVQRDGDVIDLNGEDGLRFRGLDVDDYYVVVRHRNHLGAMTAVAKTPVQLATLIDFTVTATGFFDFGSSKNIYDYTGLAQATLSGSAASNKTGYRALWGGDFDGNGKIKFTNPEDDLNNLLGNVFLYEIVPGVEYNFFTNFDFAFGYASGDYDLNSKSKFDNPNDDKNYLFGQLLFYPLNTTFRSNFDFFIEQIPENIIPN